MSAHLSASCGNHLALSRKPAQKTSSFPVKGRRVVVVDDKENVRSMLRDVLQAHGIEVQLAHDGSSALTLIRERRPDLILSDINMEGLDGYELLEHVRQDPAIAQLPFVLMTGKADLRGMRNGMSLGADDYLPKPFSVTELIEVIKRRLERNEALQLEAESRMSSLRTSITHMLPHELLTPLNGIIGVATLLETGEASNEDLVSYSEMLKESGERLHRVILNFLTLAQLELLAHDPERRAQLGEEETPSDGEWLTALAADLAAKWNRRSDLSLSLAPLRLRIPRKNLAKAVSELLDNAFKFSPPGTPVILACEPADGAAAILVRDSGRGMRREHIESIGAFQQFDRKLHEQQGTGLGAIIARRIAELHGGSLAIESEPGRGATAILRIPLREP
jgi:signal transduction histidine kinase